jgi:hypothetical protein
MPSSEMLRRAFRVRTDVSEERSAFIIRMTRVGELGTKLATEARSEETLSINLYYSISSQRASVAYYC